ERLGCGPTDAAVPACDYCDLAFKRLLGCSFGWLCVSLMLSPYTGWFALPQAGGRKMRVNDSRRRSAKLPARRITFGEAPLPGPMQSRRPVRGGGQVGRVRIQMMLPDAGLGELERVRIVGRDGAFNDGRRLLWRPLVAFG